MTYSRKKGLAEQRDLFVLCQLVLLDSHVGANLQLVQVVTSNL